MVEWKDLTLERLRAVAQYYNKDVKIVGISKMKKADLTAELKKHIKFDGTTFTHKTKNIEYEFEADTPKPKKATPAPKAPAPPASAPKPTPKQTDDFLKKMLLEEQVKKGKAKAKDAVGDASAIKGIANNMKQYKMLQEDYEGRAKGKRISKELDIMDARRKTVEKKAVAQGKGASADAKAIAPPEEEKETPKGERSEKNLILNIVRSEKTKLRKRITEISDEVGVKLPRGVLTKYMYSEELRKGTNEQFGTSLKGQNTGRQDLSTNEMLKVALSYMGDKKKEFLTKLFNLIY